MQSYQNASLDEESTPRITSMSVCDFQIALPKVPLLQDMTSVQDVVASRWEKWFSDSPLLSIPTSEDDPFLKDYILPEKIQCTEKETYLRKAYASTKNPLLNTAQVHVIMAFMDLMHSSNDALALRVLLHDRLLCCCGEEYTNLIQVYLSAICSLESGICRRLFPSSITLFQSYSHLSAG